MWIPFSAVCSYPNGTGRLNDIAVLRPPGRAEAPTVPACEPVAGAPRYTGRTIPYGVPSMISVQASTSPLSEPSSL